MNKIIKTYWIIYYNELISLKENISKGINYSKEIVLLLNKLLGNPNKIQIGLVLLV